jgi:hypothetical protein
MLVFAVATVVLSYAPQWVPVEALVSTSELIVDATLTFEEGLPRLVIHDVLKGNALRAPVLDPDAFSWALGARPKPGRALLFFADGRFTSYGHHSVWARERLPLDGLRCQPEYYPVDRIDETGTRFSCSEQIRLGLTLNQLSPRGHCERPAYGPLRCEGLPPDGGPAGQLRRAVFDRWY